MANPLRILPKSLAVVLLPAAARGGPTELRATARLVTIAGLVLSAGYLALVVAMPLGVPVILGSAYRPAVPTLQITCGGLACASSAALVSAVLQGQGHSHYVAVTAIVTTVTCLVGVVIGGATFGAVGAAAALAASFLLQAVLLQWRLRQLIMVR